MDRVDQELELVKTAYRDLEYTETDGKHWVRIPRYPVPDQWTLSKVEVAFQIPPSTGQAPYGFWVKPGLTLADGTKPDNYTFPAPTPWGDDWGQFSWSPAKWVPKEDIRAGDNLLNFVRSFADRLNEGK
jgi:hypothetical protein